VGTPSNIVSSEEAGGEWVSYSSRPERAPRNLVASRRRSVPAARPLPRSKRTDHVRTNLALWEDQSDRYERRLGRVLSGPKALAWGLWRVPESELKILGDVRGLDILELGCGAARWSIALAGKGGRPVGLDLSPTHLRHASRLVHRSRQRVPLVRANAEMLPFRDAAFDLVFCDWGAMTFCDPFRTVPEVSRVLRRNGCLAFATSSPLRVLAQNPRTNRMGPRLLYDYFGLHRVDYPNEVNFALPYGEWIRLFRENGFSVERLAEIRPSASARSAYLGRSESKWARHWPLESIWKVRKE